MYLFDILSQTIPVAEKIKKCTSVWSNTLYIFLDQPKYFGFAFVHFCQGKRGCCFQRGSSIGCCDNYNEFEQSCCFCLQSSDYGFARRKHARNKSFLIFTSKFDYLCFQWRWEFIGCRCQHVWCSAFPKSSIFLWKVNIYFQNVITKINRSWKLSRKLQKRA